MRVRSLRGVVKRIAGLAAAAVAAATRAAAFELRPIPPPGLSDYIQKLLGWGYWLAIVACVGGMIYGAAQIHIGHEKGKMYFLLGVIGVILLAALPRLLGALVPGF